MSLDLSNPWWVDPFAILHNDSSTFAYADGHADRHKWVNKYTKLMCEEGTKGHYATVNGNAGSAPNEDYIWFRKSYIPGRIPSILK